MTSFETCLIANIQPPCIWHAVLLNIEKLIPSRSLTTLIHSLGLVEPALVVIKGAQIVNYRVSTDDRARTLSRSFAVPARMWLRPR
jgi:hypothetical protein